MRWSRMSATIVLGLVVLAGLSTPAGATTLIRAGLDQLTASNELVVLAQVVDLHSYWNAERTHIFTDVRVKPEAVLKGSAPAPELTLQLLGGTVGDWSTLIVAGPCMVPGSKYVLFLSQGETSAGESGAWVFPDHAQGVFEVVKDEAGAAGARAVSQAAKHPLLPDEQGIAEVPGGEQGLPLDEMMSRVRELAQ